MFKKLQIVVEGPIWNDVIQIANKKLNTLQESVINKNFIAELKPLLMLCKSSNWDQVGSQILKRTSLVNTIKMFGKNALK